MKSTRVYNQAPRQLRHFVLRGTVPEGLMHKLVGISEYDEKHSTNDQSGHLVG